MAERGKYTARVITAIEAALPAHAHIDEDLRKWVATWTTPDGLWRVEWRDPNTEATTLTATGPKFLVRQEYPSDGGLVLHFLRKLNAVAAAPGGTGQDHG